MAGRTWGKAGHEGGGEGAFRVEVPPVLYKMQAQSSTKSVAVVQYQAC
jgi:hypothetical protein